MLSPDVHFGVTFKQPTRQKRRDGVVDAVCVRVALIVVERHRIELRAAFVTLLLDEVFSRNSDAASVDSERGLRSSRMTDSSGCV